MKPLTYPRQLEIAKRVHDTFSSARRWHQGGWGRDDDGDALEFDGCFHVVDARDRRVPPAFYTSNPDSPRCFCLGAAIRIHTGNVLGFDPAYTGDTTETVSAVYTRVGRIDTSHRELDAADFEPQLNSVIDWNDSEGRSYEDVRDLTATALRHLETRRW